MTWHAYAKFLRLRLWPRRITDVCEWLYDIARPGQPKLDYVLDAYERTRGVLRRQKAIGGVR